MIHPMMEPVLVISGTFFWIIFAMFNYILYKEFHSRYSGLFDLELKWRRKNAIVTIIVSIIFGPIAFLLTLFGWFVVGFIKILDSSWWNQEVDW